MTLPSLRDCLGRSIARRADEDSTRGTARRCNATSSLPRQAPILPISAMQALPILAPLSLVSSLAAALFVPSEGHTQLLPNRSMPVDQQPVLLRTASGVPQIDITRPTTAGVSINQFRQFDVDAQGAVINNGRKASQTGLAGWVAANPALASGEASVIVNEIRSSNSSLLRGYLEIAGGKAKLVVANPAGISCDGCGFIHASRVVLATANPLFEQGSLIGYAPGKGSLEISGRGLDALRVDAFSVITQAARVNAGIWANHLGVTLQSGAASSGTLEEYKKPFFALDVAEIGGMYANRIWLVGTADGLGVRNAGTWSAGESLVVSIDGKLENSGSIDARMLSIEARNIDNVAHGKLLGERITLQADRIANAGHPDASPVIAADAEIKIAARMLENTDQAALFSGGDLHIGYKLDSEGRLIGKSEQVLNRFSTIEALGKLDISSEKLQNLNNGVETEEVQIGPTVQMAYLQPNGSSTKYSMDHFIWTPWSRAGQYKWVSDKSKLENGIPGKTPLPDVDGVDCVIDDGNERCTPTPGSAYPSDDPAWAYFKLTPPDNAPPRPGPEPQSPDSSGLKPLEPNASPEAKLAWETERAAFDAASAKFFIEKSAYDQAMQRFDQWRTTTEERRDALDAAINAYNAGFSQVNIRSWTQFNVRHAEFETRVTRSAPGRIIAGGDMTLTSDLLVNDRSQIIAGGRLIGEFKKLENIVAIGAHRVNESGTSQFTRSAYRGRIRDYHSRVWGPILPYNPADDITTLLLPVTIMADRQKGMLPAPAIDTFMARLAKDGSSLFRMNPSSGPLFVTDPRFTQYRQWLSSDLMLAQLAIDPERLQKRLGDGYLEQRLISEQIAQLTGRRFLPEQMNDEAQYAALMASGVKQASTLALVPGISLTSAQIEKLSADIVWLVEKEISLPTRAGQQQSTNKVLVPQVYLLPRSGDLDGSGTLISGQRMKLAIQEALENEGLIASDTDIQLYAGTINNSGTVKSDTAMLIAKDDISIAGGEISTQGSLSLVAGRDVAIESTTRNSERNSLMWRATGNSSQTGIDRTARMHTENVGQLKMLAGRNIMLNAAQITNQDGDIVVVAGKDLSIGTIAVHSSVSGLAHGSANFMREAESAEIGTSIQAQGSILMAAGEDMSLRAAAIESISAVVALSASHDMTVSAGEVSRSYAQGTELHHHSLAGSRTSTRRISEHSTNAIPSSIDGRSVMIDAGRDLNIIGSDITGNQSSTLQAGRDVVIDAAGESKSSTFLSRETSSGLMSGPGLSIGIGSRRQQDNSEHDATHQRGSRIGTLTGNLDIAAGDGYRQQASQIIAPTASINIEAVNVDISGGHDTTESHQTSSFSQSGVSIGVSNPVIDTARSLEKLHSTRQQTRSGRAKALAVAAAGLSAANTAKEVAKDPAHAGGVTVAITVGNSKSKSSGMTRTSGIAPSIVAAGTDVDVHAEGKPNSALHVAGSKIVAGNAVRLNSEGKLSLEAQANTETQTTSNHNSSAGIGIAASIGKEGTGLGLILKRASGGGKAAGEDVSWTNTQVTAGEFASLGSRGDAELKGAVVKAPVIKAAAAGDLLIESLQDSSRYNSHQKSVSGSVTIPLTGSSSPSAQVNLAKSNIKSDYLNTAESSGLQAGDGGFRVQVDGKTTLKGAVITSSDKAVEAGTNQFSSADLAMTDLQNHAEYKAEAVGIGMGIGRYAQSEYAPKGNSAGLGIDGDKQASTTTSGISGISGNKNVRTGDASSGLDKIFNAERVAKEINAQVAITQEFTGQAYKSVGNYVAQNRRALRLALKETDDVQVKQLLNDQLAQLRREEQVMNILIGALAGFGEAAVTKEGLSAAAEKMRKMMIEDSKKFIGITDENRNTVLSNVSGKSIGNREDELKIGGGRVDLDIVCGMKNERCTMEQAFDENISKISYNPDGTIKFHDPLNPQMTLNEFLETEQGKKLIGMAGGIQGEHGELFGIRYSRGDLFDRLVETFSGPHDVFGGAVVGLYDEQGNIVRGLSNPNRLAHEVWSYAAVIPATPFAMADLLPPAVWQGISLIISGAR